MEKRRFYLSKTDPRSRFRPLATFLDKLIQKTKQALARDEILLMNSLVFGIDLSPS